LPLNSVNSLNSTTNPTNTTTLTTLISQLQSSPDLKWKDNNPNVKLLQQYLNSTGYTVNSNPGQPGSLNFETTVFGDATRDALIKYQKANNITPSEGYFGGKTRAGLR
jgi:peptidoglycan hydrolase-like protein with peptidoglycan-binding domain